MTCKHCNYCWPDEGQTYPTCHYQGSWAPCELPDDSYDEQSYWEDIESELGL